MSCGGSEDNLGNSVLLHNMPQELNSELPWQSSLLAETPQLVYTQCFLLFWYRVSLHRPAWPGNSLHTKIALNSRAPSASKVLEFKEETTILDTKSHDNTFFLPVYLFVYLYKRTLHIEVIAWHMNADSIKFQHVGPRDRTPIVRPDGRHFDLTDAVIQTFFFFSFS